MSEQAEVAVRDDRPEQVESVEEVEFGSPDLLRFARDMGLAYSCAVSLVKTPFVPAQYQNNPGTAAAAIMTGRGVGITDPLAALRSIDIIQGTPAFRANTLRALVQREGHRIWVEEASSQRAVVKGQRKGSDQVEQSVWDMDRARQMNLTGKDNWKKQPQAMLVARATSEVARLIAADVILGLYAAEELADGQVPAPVAEVVEPPRRKVKRRPSPKTEPVEVAEPETVPVEAQEAAGALDGSEVTPEVTEAVEGAQERSEPVEGVVEGPPVEGEEPAPEEDGVLPEVWGDLPDGWDS